VAFLNDLGFLYGAGIAQKRQAASFLLNGWSVSIFASQPTPVPRYAFVTGNPKLDRRLAIRAPLSASADAIANAIMTDSPELVIVGNIHGAEWPIGILTCLRECGASVIAYMHDCYWVTGRCAYPRSCTRYITGCDASCPTPDEHPRLAPEKISAAWRERGDCFTGPGAIPLVANSTWTARLARQRFPSARIDVIHLGLDHNLFAPIEKAAARRMLCLSVDKPVIVLGSINIHDEFKGGILFRDLCALLVARSDIHVAVIGKGSGSIEGVRPFGLVNDERLMPLILSCADIYVSTAIEEAFGQMLLEAAACGVPTVAVGAGGVSDIVTAETGILVHDKSAASLMKAIDVLLSDDALRQRMGRAARARILQNFTLSHQAKAWNGYLADFTTLAHPLR
jgi:glycosyltransferase involved in cell wall biosynthesis